MNVVKFVLKSVGVVCVPLAFLEGVGSPGFVDGASMEPTLRGSDRNWWKNDVVWLSRLYTKPREGQVFVFTSPKDPQRVFIKRIVATPGRQVQWKDKTRLVVPHNHYWVRADNPENAMDSQVFGAVNNGLLLAKATRIIWPPHRWQKL
ncbi:Mitochondrial inner membrane protease subunit 2 [Aphelenchoides fujianensis]|nr:Mitochondrial inner membrane protease subunit 2 [Aphelenchoides fujianensis]